MSYGWPDIIIVVAAAIMIHKGWKRGFVSELGGIVALFVACAAALFYNGFGDLWIKHVTGLSLDSSHVIGMSIFAISSYGIMALIGMLLQRSIDNPVASPINSFFGAVLGLLKAAVLYWLILYVALFFPLSRALRGDLRHSFIIPILVSHNDELDQHVRAGLPWFVRPFSGALFRRHSL